MKKIIGLLCLFSAVLILTGCNNESRKVSNVEAFARLYGYARWFHPSDEAQQVDWDKFAVYGVRKVENLRTDLELKDALYELFSPIVPGLEIFTTGDTGKFDLTSLIPPDDDKRPVYWQHYGIRLGEGSNIYESTLVNSLYAKTEGGFLRNHTDIEPGTEIRLTAYCKSELKSDSAKAQLFFSFYEGPGKEIKVAEGIGSVPINSGSWEKYEIDLPVPENAAYAYYGCTVNGNAQFWIDDVRIYVKRDGRWVETQRVNMDLGDGRAGWFSTGKAYEAKAANDGLTDRSNSIHFAYKGKLFEGEPQFGEVIEKPLNGSLSCRLPLVLYTTDTGTYPKTDTESFNRLRTEVDKVSLSDEKDNSVYQASVLIAWNALQHFFPYFDVIETRWDDVLAVTLEKARKDRSKLDIYKTLSEMTALLEDGHGWVNWWEMFHLPIKTELLGNDIVITASQSDQLTPGDIITQIDGVTAMQSLEEVEKYISGSPHLKRHRALNILGSKYKEGMTTKLRILRNGETLNVTLPNNYRQKNMFFNTGLERGNYESITEPEPGIFYVNMSKCRDKTFESKLQELAGASAVIYDFRGGGRLNLGAIIPHLIDEPVSSTWWEIPTVIYPDRTEMTFNTSNWDVQPKQPRFTSKAVIINEPSVVSAGETMMAIIDNNNLAVTVGEPTAGCNGNINRIDLPCGYQVSFTGMKVRKHDGSQLYGIGYVPDYPVERTVQDVLEGRDAVLEKALEVARTL